MKSFLPLIFQDFFFTPFGLELHFIPNKYSCLCKTVQYVKFSRSLIQLKKGLWIQVETDTIFPAIFLESSFWTTGKTRFLNVLNTLEKSPIPFMSHLCFENALLIRLPLSPKGIITLVYHLPVFLPGKKQKSRPERFLEQGPQRVSTIFSLFCFQKEMY